MKTQRPAVARVARKFGASPERVFDAWLDPAKVPIWWKIAAAAAGRGATETLERVVIDAHVGGSFSILVRRDGKLIDHTGTYLEIDRPLRLVFTWAAIDAESGAAKLPKEGSPDFSKVTIEIAASTSGCEVTLSHEMHPDWSAFVERAVNAWSLMLEAIDGVFSEQPA